MTRPVQDWRTDLVETHPRLFQAPTWGPETAQGWPTSEARWQDILERACTRIEATLVESDTFRVLQIKEKFGILRFYWDGTLSSEATAQVEEAIALAAARSACTCELCDAEGQL